MKKSLLIMMIILALGLFTSLVASATSYNFAYSTNTFNYVSGGTSLGTITSDDQGWNIPLPWNFTFNGTSYANVRMDQNGWLAFYNGTAPTSTAYGNGLSTANPFGTGFGAVCPLWDDLYYNTTIPAVNSWVSTGSAPYRTLTFEWKNALWGSAGPNIDMQVQLFESTWAINFAYNSLAAATAKSASIGLIDATGGAGHFLSVTPAATPTVSSTVANDAVAVNTYLTDGMTYSFTPASLPSVTLTAPLNGSITALYPTLTWTGNWGAAGNPTGYNLYVGSADGTWDYLGGFDVGNAQLKALSSAIGTMYNSTLYYWKVVPYYAGRPDGIPSPTWSFRTQSAAALTGTKTIDPAGSNSGNNYLSFSSAIADLNAVGVGTGGVTFNVAAGLTFTELAPAITAQGTSGNPIVFQKSGGGANPIIYAGVGIGTADAIIALNGADYVTFDGIDVSENAANTTTTMQMERGYYIYNASATNGAQNNIIKNCKITLNRTNTSARGIYQFTAVTPTNQVTGNNNNNTYDHVIVENAFAGIYLNATSTTYYDENTTVSYCTIGAATANDIGNASGAVYGMYVGYQKGFLIYNNEIRNLTSTTGGYAANGIYLTSVLGSYTSTPFKNAIYNNKIHDITSLYTSSASYPAVGIQLSSYTTGTNDYRIYNNMIWNLTHAFAGTATASTYSTYGIWITSGGATNTYNVDFNNIRITSPTNASNACVYFGASTGINKLRDNILANFTAGNATPYHLALYSSSATTIGAATSISDNNIMYIDNTTGGYPVRGSSTNYATIAAWKTATGALNFDLNSKASNPQYDAANYLHILTGTPTPVESNGSFFAGAITWAANDIDNNVRNASTPDIGADEGSFTTEAVCVAPITQPSVLLFGQPTSTVISGSFTAAAAPGAEKYLVLRGKAAPSSAPVDGSNYTAGTWYGNSMIVQANNSLTFSATVNPDSLYTFTVYAFNASGTGVSPKYNVTTPLSDTKRSMIAVPAAPVSMTATAVSTTQINLAVTPNAVPNDIFVAWAPNSTFGTPRADTTYAVGNRVAGGGNVLYMGPAAGLGNHTGLTQVTPYYYKVWSRALDGTYSLYVYSTSVVTANATTFMTPVSAMTEGFEGTTGSALPAGWSATEDVAGATYHWETVTTDAYGAAAPHGGLRMARIYNYLATTTYNNYNLITQPLDLSGAGKQISYWVYIPVATTAVPPMHIDISTDNKLTWTTLYTHVLPGSGTWVQNTINLSSYSSANAFIRFSGKSDYDRDYDIDDVVLENAPLISITSVTPNPVAFGNTYIGFPRTMPVLINNTGGGTLTINPGGITLTTGTLFTLGTLSYPYSIAPGTSASINITYTPTVPNADTDVLNITSTDGSTTWNVTGTGITPTPGVSCESPFALTLPVVAYSGTTAGYYNDYNYNMFSPAQSTSYFTGEDWVGTFTLTEDSKVSGTIGYVGMYYPSLYIVNTIPSIATPAVIKGSALGGYTSSTSFTNMLLPAGTYFAIVDNAYSYAAGTFTLDMSAVAAGPSTLVVAPITKDFGSMPINPSVPPTQVFTLSNTGGGTISISSIDFAGGSSPYYAISGLPVGFPGTPISLGLGSSTTFTVTYNPTGVGTHIGTVNIVNNAVVPGTSPATISLTGSAVDPTVYTLPFTEGFETGYTNSTVIGFPYSQVLVTGSYAWTANNTLTDYNRSPRTGAWNAYVHYSCSTWMFRPFQLTGGQSYTFTMFARQDMADTSYSYVRIAYGTAGTDAGMTNNIVSRYPITNGGYQKVKGNFIPATSGIYYIGIYGYMNGTPWYISIDDIDVRETPANPLAPSDPSPALAAVNQLPTANLGWTINGNTTKVDVYFSTSQTDVTNKAVGALKVANQLDPLNSYDLPTLAYNTPYYWRIVAKNDADIAVDGPVWSFTTMLDPSIAALPYAQNWDAVTAPALPYGYAVIGSAGTSGYAYTYAYSSYSAPNTMYWYGGYDTSETLTLLTPNITVPMNSFRVGFYAHGSSTGQTLQVGTVNSQAPDATFTPFGAALAMTSTYAYYEVDFASFAGTDRYIAFQPSWTAAYQYFYLDNLSMFVVPAAPTFEITPTVKAFGNVVVGENNTQIFTIHNAGAAAFTLTNIAVTSGSSYFTIVNAPTPLPTLAYNQTATFGVQFAPLANGAVSAVVTVADDIARTSHTINVSGTGTPPQAIPYTENFDGAAPSYIYAANSTSNPVTSNWVIGAPTKSQITAAHSAPNAMVTTILTGANTADNENYSATLPSFDVSSFTTGVAVSFWHNFYTESGYDAGILEYKTPLMANWGKVNATVGTGGNFTNARGYNWYNSTSTSGPITPPKWSNVSTAYTGAVGGWIQSSVLIPRDSLGAATTLKLRFHWGTDSSANHDGWAIDDINIQQQPLNEYAIGALTITGPTVYKMAGQPISFSVPVTNYGFNTTGTNVNIKVGSTLIGSFPTGPIPFGITQTVTGTAIFTTGGTYDIFAELDADAVLTNNTSNTITGVLVYGPYQLVEGFEGATYPPVRWLKWSAPTYNQWVQGTTPADGLVKNAELTIGDVANTGAFLVTPQLNFLTGSTFKFMAKATDTVAQIQLMKTTVASSTNPADYTLLGAPISLTTTYVEQNVDVSSLTGARGVYRIAFVGVPNTSIGTIYIDKVIGPDIYYPNTAPDKVVMLAPANDAVQVDPKTFVFDWDPPTSGGNPDTYYVNFSTNPLSVDDNSKEIIAPITQYQPYLDPLGSVLLNYNTLYYWQVVPLHGELFPDPVDTWSFRTKAQMQGAANLAIGTISPTVEKTGVYTVTNVGNTELYFNVTGVPADIVFNTTLPHVIPANSSFDLPYTFTGPGSTGAYDRTFTLVETTPGSSSQVVHITATIALVAEATIGTGSSTQSAPFNIYYGYSRTASLYTQAEIGTYSQITNLSWYCSTTGTGIAPYWIYIYQTPNTTMATDTWANIIAGATLVKSGTKVFDTVGWHTFTLDTPFNYTSGNLVVVTRCDFGGSGTPSGTYPYFNYTPTIAYEALISQQDTTPPTSGSTSTYRPNIKIGMAAVANSGSLSGYATAGGTPVTGVTVAITGASLSCNTNTVGRYNFPSVAPGTYSVTATKVGYYTATLPATITQDVTTHLNFPLTALPVIQVTGRVLDNGGLPMVGAGVALVGPNSTTYNGTTITGGYFTITGVTGTYAYNYTITMDAHTNLTGSFTAGTTNYDMGTLTINELTNPVSALVAVDANTQVDLTWNAPGGFQNQFMNFEANNGSFTAINASTPGWDWGVSSYAGAYSGSKVWGCSLSGGTDVLLDDSIYELISPQYQIGTGASISFYHRYNFETSWDGGHLMISPNGGTDWFALTPDGGYPDDAVVGLDNAPGYTSSLTTWTLANFDLSTYADQAVMFKWQMGTDSSTTYDGWFIDDVSLLAGTRRSAPAVQFAAQMNDRSLQGYKVWRLPVGQEANELAWTLLTPSPVSTSNYSDMGWTSLGSGNFKWAVKACYSGGIYSAAVISNNLVHLLPPTVVSSAITGPGVLRVSWDAVSGANAYKVLSSSDPAAPLSAWHQEVFTSSTHYDYSMGFNEKMFFIVKAVNIVRGTSALTDPAIGSQLNQKTKKK